jgi:hypothetical protein
MILVVKDTGGRGYGFPSPLNFFLDLTNGMCIMENILNKTNPEILPNHKLNLDT